MTLKVATLNLWHDQGPWAARAERIRAWLDRLDPDLVGFQEALRGPGLDQVAELLGARLPHRDYGCAGIFRRASGPLEFGNAVASRWPLVGREEQKLPDRGGENPETRAALHVDVDAPFGPLAFTCTHLHWRFHHGDTRLRQVQALVARVIARRPKAGFPPIVVGDFNAEPEWDEIRYLTGGHALDGKTVYFHDAWRKAGRAAPHPGEPPGCTWSNRNRFARLALEPDRRIDYVFAGYPTAQGLGLIERCEVAFDDVVDGVWPSDHFGVYAELRTEPLPEGYFA